MGAVAATEQCSKVGRRPSARLAQRQLDARQQDAAPLRRRETAPAADSLRLVAASAEQGSGTSESGSADPDSRLRVSLNETKEQLGFRLNGESRSPIAGWLICKAQMDTLRGA